MFLSREEVPAASAGGISHIHRVKGAGKNKEETQTRHEVNREESTEGWGALRSCTDCTARVGTSGWFGFGWSWEEAGGLTGWSVIATMLEGTCCSQ